MFAAIYFTDIFETAIGAVVHICIWYMGGLRSYGLVSKVFKHHLRKVMFHVTSLVLGLYTVKLKNLMKINIVIYGE